MRNIFTVFILFISHVTFGQSIQSITAKVTTEICNCMSNKIKSYSGIKPEFDKCYDKQFNQIFSIVDSEEQKILVQKDAIEKVKNGIIPTLNNTCDKVKRVIDSELQNSVEPASGKNSQAFPTNFNEDSFKKIKKRENEIVALEGKVIQVETNSKKTPYSKLEIGNKHIWVISMVDSGFEKIGNNIKIVGYLIPLEKNDYERKFNQDNYQILAFGILDMKTTELAYFPGTEMQMKEWRNGQIPSSGE
jgi:Zn-dependent M32 family carboxypeptidase